MTDATPEPGDGGSRSSVDAAVDHSRFLHAVGALRTGRHEWSGSSVVWRLGSRTERIAATAAVASVVGGLVRTLGRWTRHSAGYRWLTREPEPEVLVIDLRETVMVGPVIEGLDRVSEALRPALRGSTLAESVAAQGTRVRVPGTVLEGSRAVRLLAAVLEPPEPPGGSGRSTEEAERRPAPDGERRATETERG